MNHRIYSASLLVLIIASCSRTNKTQSEVAQPVQVVAHDESSDPHKFYQDSISRLERDSMMKNGSEEELMRQMQNEENIFLKYQHRFKAMMVNEEIPTSFPEYTSGTSEQSYMEKVNFWIDANPELIKPQYRN